MKTTASSANFSSPSVPSRALLFGTILLLTGCVSSKYQTARKDTPPSPLLSVAFSPAPLAATLQAVITYNGPGSWKRNANWDEYVVTLHNPGRESLTVSAAGLIDFTGTPRPAGSDPWALERESKTLEQKYQDAGIAFIRYSAPGVFLASAGVSLGSAAYLSTSAAAASALCLVTLPAYYVGVLTVNHYNKAAMEKEFVGRRLALPLALAPGETRTGSFFFPMVPNPRSLGLRWSTGPASGESVLALDFLHGLHVKTPASAATAKQGCLRNKLRGIHPACYLSTLKIHHVMPFAATPGSAASGHPNPVKTRLQALVPAAAAAAG